MGKAQGKFQVTAWDENPYHEDGGRKQTLAVVGQAFSGDVTGEGEARWLMAYGPDGTARFVGLQRVDGEFASRRGSFVMETSGTFDGSEARWTAAVIDGAGGGELEQLSGSGTFAAPRGSEATYELDLELVRD